MKQKKEIDVIFHDKETRKRMAEIVNGLFHGVAKYWWSSGSFRSIDIFQKGERTLETECKLHRNVLDVPTNQVLFGKEQWKELCEK